MDVVSYVTKKIRALNQTVGQWISTRSTGKTLRGAKTKKINALALEAKKLNVLSLPISLITLPPPIVSLSNNGDFTLEWVNNNKSCRLWVSMQKENSGWCVVEPNRKAEIHGTLGTFNPEFFSRHVRSTGPVYSSLTKPNLT